MRNQQIPERILGRRRFPEAEWLNRRVKCQRFSTPNQNARGAVLEIVEEFLKVSPITATRCQSRAVFQDDLVFAMKHRVQFLDSLEIDYCGAMNTKKFIRVESVLQTVHCGV